MSINSESKTVATKKALNRNAISYNVNRNAIDQATPTNNYAAESSIIKAIVVERYLIKLSRILREYI